MNISKIAQLSGVSPATVSRYLNHGYVSEDKKEKIAKVIQETGYVPSPSARTLRTKKNYIIGVIVPKISSESISKMVEGITSELKMTKYNILLANTDNSPYKELEFLSIFKNNTVDGVILMGTILTKKHLDIITSYTKPIILLGQYEKGISCVYYDDYGVAYNCTEKLVKCGCKKIAYIGVTTKDKAVGQSRLNGYTSCILNNGLALNSKLMAESEFSSNSGYQAMKRILTINEGFDGLFCVNDSIAAGAMKCLAEHNIHVPKDVKIMSIGDSKIANLCTPTLSSAHLYYITGGQEACRMLLDSLENENRSVRQHMLGYEIFSRDSTSTEWYLGN